MIHSTELDRPVRVVVAGSRTITDYNTVEQALLDYLRGWVKRLPDVEIVSGGAEGVDSLAAYFAREYDLEYKEFAADWNQYGKAAGPIRNKRMAEYGDVLIAVWDGKSSGTQNMVDSALEAGNDVVVLQVDQREQT